MDYQNGAHLQGGPAHSLHPHFSPQSSSSSPSNAPAPHQSDPHSRFTLQQPPTQHHYNNGAAQFPMQHPMANGGAMMRQAQMQTRGPSNYLPQSGAYTQSIPAPPVTAPQKLAQINHTASPPNQTSPYSTPPGSQAPLSDPSRTPPMAAPSSTQPLAQQGQSGAQGQPRSVPQSPLTAEAQTRERERMALVLEINTELLQEVVNLQSQGKGGAVEGTAKTEGQQASKEYFELLRRLQANLSYLASNAERYTSKPTTSVPPGPAIMSAPPSPASLQDLYTRLQALFPGWKGQSMVKNSPQQRPNPSPLAGGAGTPSSQGSFGTPSQQQQPMMSNADYKP